MSATATLGQPLARVDGKLKVTGAATYAAEFVRPKLAYGVLIQSAIANGRVNKIDISAAKSAPGVVGILTRENAPQFKPYPDDLTKKGAPGENRVPLQDDEIHYAGQHLGVVVAVRAVLDGERSPGLERGDTGYRPAAQSVSPHSPARPRHGPDIRESKPLATVEIA